MRLKSILLRTLSICILFLSQADLIAYNPITVERIDQVQETCNLANGALTIIVAGDTTGLSYSIDGGITFFTSHEFINLESGDYLIVVSDGTVCTEIVTAQIADAPQPTVSLTAECIEGQNRVVITPNPEGGIYPYSFDWSGPNGTDYNDDVLYSVIPGDYMVTVIDALGCMFSDTVSITTCCELQIDCALRDTTVTCPSAFPEIPATVKSAGTNEEITDLLLALGITIRPGSCGDLAVDVIDIETNTPDCGNNELIISREYTISDAHSSYTCNKEITILNYLPVELITEAEDATIYCGSNIEDTFQQWLANHGGMVLNNCADLSSMTMTPDNPTIDTKCGSSVEVTFEGEDFCGNKISSTAIFSIEDEEAPSISCPNDLEINPTAPDMGDQISNWLQEANSNDNCSDNAISNDLVLSAISTDCTSQPILPVTFSVSDDCDNSNSCTANLNVVAPSSSVLNCGDDLIVQCGDDIEAEVLSWIAAFVAENSNGNQEPADNDLDLNTLSSLECNEDIEVSFTYEDECFRLQDCSRKILLLDDEKPEISCPAELVISDLSDDIEDLISNWLETASAEDNCTPDLTATHDFDTDISNPCELTEIPVVFSVKDNCDQGNSCDSKILFQFAAPSLTCPEPLLMNCSDDDKDEQIQSWIETAVATNHNGNPIETDMPSALPNNGCYDEIPVLYTITNNCGSSENCSSSILITDEENPEITCPTDIIVDQLADNLEEQIATWIETASATDCNSFELTNNLDINYNLLGCSEDIPVTFLARDLCDLESNCTAMLSIENSGTIDIECPPPLTMSCADPLIDFHIQNYIDGILVTADNPYETFSDFDASLIDADCVEPLQIDINISGIDQCDNEASCRARINIEPEPTIYVPNVFSPDGDGLNDYFTVYGNTSIESIKKLIIFNRWGEKVFEQEDFLHNMEENGWDGTYQGKMEKNNVYTYHAVAIATSGEEIDKAGTVQILKK